MARSPRVAFLFLGETLLIPHLYPIVEALAALAPELRIDAWVATSVHEGLIARWLDEAGVDRARVRIRRAPGFLDHPTLRNGENPPLPTKIPTLARLLPWLLPARVIVCAEQTSLWLPNVLPFLPMRFIMTAHGAGSVSNRKDRRRERCYRLFLSSDKEADELARFGKDRARMVTTGYVKAGFTHRTPPQSLFAEKRPIILYTPHWQQHRSSWWAWGREVVAILAGQDRYNVILAPHQRLIEKDPQIREVLEAAGRLPHVHADLDSFAMVDGSYTAAADLYLGDTSSQVGEFLMRPRPCVFLNPERLDWYSRDDYGFWECGEVVEALADLPAALDRAFADQPRYEAAQRRFVEEVIGDTSPEAAHRAATAVLEATR